MIVPERAKQQRVRRRMMALWGNAFGPEGAMLDEEKEKEVEC